jgi:hypothetical protein
VCRSGPDPVAEIEHHRLGAHLVRLVVVMVVTWSSWHVRRSVSNPAYGGPTYGKWSRYRLESGDADTGSVFHRQRPPSVGVSSSRRNAAQSAIALSSIATTSS